MAWIIYRSIATCRTSPCWRPNITSNRRAPARRCASRGVACLIFACLVWFGAASFASADDAPPAELVIDLRPRAAAELVPDSGVAEAEAGLPAPAYRRAGQRTLSRVQVSPWPPRQGQTLVVSLTSAKPVTHTVTFDNRPYRANPGEGMSKGAWSLVPVPPLARPGYIPLAIQAGPERFTLYVPVAAGEFETVNIPVATAAPILGEQVRVSAEAERMTKLFAQVTPGGWNPRSRFTPPLIGVFRHSSPFGSRRTYGNDPALSAHAGEDYSAPTGTPVYAPADGKVVLAEPLFVRGNAIILDHGNGVFTGYWHLSELTAQPGETAKAGQLLGKVGSTGLSTGAHLHWELRIAGMAVDPLQWVE